MALVSVAKGQMTIVDLTDSRQLVAYIGSSNRRQVIFNPDTNEYKPNYKEKNNTLSPEIYLAGSTMNRINDATSVEWSVQVDSIGAYQPIVEGTTYALGVNHTLTIKENVLETNLSMVYKVNIVYKDTQTQKDILVQADIELVKLENGSTGQTIKNTIVTLSNDSQVIPTDSKGNGGIYTNVTTTIQVFTGIEDVTEGWTKTAVASEGVTGNLVGTTYTVTDLTKDEGYVDLNVEKGGEKLTKRFSLSKAKSGYTPVKGVDYFDGAQGETSYTHLAYADSVTGEDNFSLEAGERKYLGVYSDFKKDGELIPTKYVWSKIRGEDGVTGEDAITVYLTNDFGSITTDSDGNEGDYTNAKTEVKVFAGTVDVTASWVITYKESLGLTGTLLGATYQTTDLSQDQGEVEFTVTKGDANLKKYFTVSKNKQGIKGEDSSIYRLKKSHSILIKDKEGKLTPNVLEFSSSRLLANNETPFLGYYVIYERAIKGLTMDEYTHIDKLGFVLPDREYIVTDVERPYVKRYESIQAEAMLYYIPNSNIVSLHVELYKDREHTELLDKETVMVASNGVDGEDSYSVEIVSSKGNIFKNGEISTTLKAEVYRGANNVTNQINATKFLWTRSSKDEEGDTAWNLLNSTGKKEVIITSEDVYVRATFSCQIQE